MDLEKRYGRLTIIGRVERVKNNYRVRVRCDCGVETYMLVHNLKSGATQSCGCLKAEQVAERIKKQAAERARETTERVEAEKRLEKLRHEVRQIARDWVTISNITNPVLNEIDNVANEIKKEAWREVQCKCEPWELRLSHGEISVAEHNRHVQPILDESKTFDEKVNGEKNRVENIWWEIVASAEQKGREAIVRVEKVSEAIFSRVTARSLLVALRKLDANRGGEIAQRLLAPIQAAQQPLQRWLAANPRERGDRSPQNPTGIVLEPASVSAGSLVTAE